MKANNTYETIIKNKLDHVNGPDSDIMWGDMKGILDVHMPQKKKRRIIGWWFFDGGSGMYLGIAILITLGSLTGYRILKNKENIAIISSESESLKKTTGDNQNITGSDNKQKEDVSTSGTNNTTNIQLQKKSEIGDQKSSANTDLSSTSSKNISSQQSGGHADRLKNNELQSKSGPANSKNRIAGLNKNNHYSVLDKKITVTTKTEPAVSLYNSADFNSLLTEKLQSPNNRITEIGNKKPASDILLAKLNQPQKKGWVIGGSFNYHMPISSQVMSTVNTNGKMGNLVDYLPSIYVQYHLNEKWYLQSEIQYSSPQYTPNHVLFDQWSNLNTHQKEEDIVYLNKLYYLSIPVTIHYSPLKNIKVGTGLQLSHMVKSILPDEHAVWQNGMEGWQRTIVNRKIYSTSPGKSKNGSTPQRIDTVSQNFRSTEFRIVLDANYNFGKLNVGFNFNTGLSNYMNLKAGTNSVLIKDRNEDLKIYLKYILLDQRRKKVKP